MSATHRFVVSPEPGECKEDRMKGAGCASSPLRPRHPSRRRQILRVTLVAAAALAPLGATVWLVSLLFGAQLSDFVPNTWNDQTSYWHWI